MVTVEVSGNGSSKETKEMPDAIKEASEKSKTVVDDFDGDVLCEVADDPTPVYKRYPMDVLQSKKRRQRIPYPSKNMNATARKNWNSQQGGKIVRRSGRG